MITVTLYVEENCSACDQALADLQALQEIVPHRVVTVPVDHDRALREKVGGQLPMVEIGPYRMKPPFTRQDLQIMLSAARDRAGQLEQVDPSYADRVARGQTIGSGDRVSLWVSNHYLKVIIVLLALYVGLTFLAPVLMKAGAEVPARILYKIYSPMCHQLAFRSWFLFGEQAYYPRELAGIEHVHTYEEIFDSQPLNLMVAREFVGNEVVGYKVALCQRDVAIYAAMLLFGIIFGLTGRRMKGIPLLAWLILGIGPIGLDGVSQLPSFASGLPDWVIMRESTPLMRSLTGVLFGWMTAWYLFPMIETTSREAGWMVRRKMAAIAQAGGEPARAKDAGASVKHPGS